jgi:hypothetical protein
MTHCDPGGNFFLGSLTAVMGSPGSIAYKGWKPSPVLFDAKKDNNRETEKFLEPHGWDVVLANWPNLKLCFAHMGGSDALLFKADAAKENTDSSYHWYGDIKVLMSTYPNVYTDISYTLHNSANWPEIKRFLNGEAASPDKGRWQIPEALIPLPLKGAADTMRDRIIFGTDYFMTEREKSEAVLARELPEDLIVNDPDNSRALYDALTETNSERYLTSTFYKP